MEALLQTYARRFPIERGKLRVINTLWRAAVGRRGPGRLARLKHGGFVMRCDLSEMLQRQFYFFGTYFIERDLLDVWAALARDAEVVLDVGANSGIYSLAALAAQPSATVYAFEPTPEIASGLRETVALNGLSNLHVEEAAVSESAGHLALCRFRGDSGDNGGMNFVVEASERQAERVRSLRLDEFVHEEGIERVDLMKLDIQGHEPAALRGAGDLLRTGRIRTLFMELNWSGAAPGPADEAIELLAKSGFRFSRVTPRLEFREPGAWMRSLTDVVARHTSAMERR